MCTLFTIKQAGLEAGWSQSPQQALAGVLFTTGQNSMEQIASVAKKRKGKPPKVLPEVLRNNDEKKVLMYDADYFSGL